MYCVHFGHLGFIQIVGVAQSRQSHNLAKFVLEHIFITNQQKTLLYSTFLGSENFKWTISYQISFGSKTKDDTNNGWKRTPEIATE